MARQTITCNYGPTTDSRLDTVDSVSQTIRDAIKSGLDEYSALLVYPRDPPAPEIPPGEHQPPRSVACHPSVIEDLDRLWREGGLAQNRAHAIRILTREHLEDTQP